MESGGSVWRPGMHKKDWWLSLLFISFAVGEPVLSLLASISRHTTSPTGTISLDALQSPSHSFLWIWRLAVWLLTDLHLIETGYCVNCISAVHPHSYVAWSRYYPFWVQVMRHRLAGAADTDDFWVLSQRLHCDQHQFQKLLLSHMFCLPRHTFLS